MSLSTDTKGGIVQQYRRNPQDTGSPEVQIALLSARINELGEHFTAHKRDHASRRGLLKMVNQRRKLLDYLKSTAPERYTDVVALVGGEVLAELVDARREQCDLHFRRARVVRVATILLDDSALCVGRQ